LHAQAAWEHQLDSSATGVRAFGGVTIRGRDAELDPTPFAIVDRLRDGPVPTLLDAGDGTDRVVNDGGRVHGSIETAGASRHTLAAGAELTRSSTSQQSAFAGRVGEMVDGVPARAWLFTDPTAESVWSSTALS